MVQIRNLYGMRAGRKAMNNLLFSRGYCAYRPTSEPLLTANHRRLCLVATEVAEPDNGSLAACHLR